MYSVLGGAHRVPSSKDAKKTLSAVGTFRWDAALAARSRGSHLTFLSLGFQNCPRSPVELFPRYILYSKGSYSAESGIVKHKSTGCHSAPNLSSTSLGSPKRGDDEATSPEDELLKPLALKGQSRSLTAAATAVAVSAGTGFGVRITTSIFCLVLNDWTLNKAVSSRRTCSGAGGPSVWL